MCVCVCVCVCARARACMCAHVCMSKPFLNIYASFHVCMYVCIHLHFNVCSCRHISVFNQTKMGCFNSNLSRQWRDWADHVLAIPSATVPTGAESGTRHLQVAKSSNACMCPGAYVFTINTNRSSIQQQCSIVKDAYQPSQYVVHPKVPISLVSAL